MMFSFDFGSLIWANMRRRIRALGPDSFWYRFLSALLLVLSERVTRANWLLRQIWFETSDGSGLILWGQRWGIPPLYGEDLDAYRNRIIEERAHLRNPTNATRKAIVSQILGEPVADVEIVRVYDHVWTVGGPVGSPIASRDYAMTAYHIYAPAPIVDDLAERGARIRRLIDRITVGAGWPEIYFNAGVGSVPSSGQTVGRRIDAAPDSPLHVFHPF